jgi:hypothetical protein
VGFGAGVDVGLGAVVGGRFRAFSVEGCGAVLAALADDASGGAVAGALGAGTSGAGVTATTGCALAAGSL